MSKNKTYMEKTAADAILVAFDYQYYFFLWKLLSLRTGESVGLEVKDDVHTELSNDEQILYQVKHTVKKDTLGQPINITASDHDLWKTLSNWSKVITDENDNRANDINQLLFLKKTTFILATNKSSGGNNAILSEISKFHKGEVSINEVINFFTKFSEDSQDDTLKGFIHDVLNLNVKVIDNFLKKVLFELDESDLIKKCKDAIKADKIPVEKIDDVFYHIDSLVRTNNYIDIRNGVKIQISFDEFYTKYRRCYDIARNGTLQIKEFSGMLPNDLHEQIFIQQLIEVEDILNSDNEDIVRFTRFKLKLQNNIDDWIKAGSITDVDVKRFEKDAFDQWFNKHRQAFRGITEEIDFNKAGLEVLDAMRDRKLMILEQLLETDLSNGLFYTLSEVPDIGWRKDWEKYKK